LRILETLDARDREIAALKAQAETDGTAWHKRLMLAASERDTLRFLRDEWEKERAALKADIMRRENEEASVCPEDVGVVEYIKSLQADVERLTKERDEATNKAVRECEEIVEHGNVVTAGERIRRDYPKAFKEGG